MRRKENKIAIIKVNNIIWKELKDIKREIHDHFENHFSNKGERPVLANLEFGKLREELRDEMVRKLSEEEV